MTFLPRLFVTSVAIILLLLVMLGVPLIKTIYFVKATVKDQGVEGSITFGTLGYCVRVSTNRTCSIPTLGYRLEINNLIVDPLPVQIPLSIVKLVTIPLCLHVIALIVAVIAAVVGLAINVPVPIPCIGTLFSSLAALITFAAFVFDIALYYIAKNRINAYGHAQTGAATWLTLVASVFLFLGGSL